MTLGSIIIAWSIRLSLLLMVATLLAWSLNRRPSQSTLATRVIWTTSCLLFLVHVLASFHFVHHWSHREAYLATAKETDELMGVKFGGGVYFNYLFLAGWMIHVGFTWFPASSSNRIVRMSLQLILIYMLFIAFNGAVVFESGWLRTLGIIATFAVALVASNQLLHAKSWQLRRRS